ncbi:MAG TPA: hypothetical protein DD727_03280 [Clostridiales bacterium]|nr:hypothetical protein [Clostridiales bacterium]
MLFFFSYWLRNARCRHGRDSRQDSTFCIAGVSFDKGNQVILKIFRSKPPRKPGNFMTNIFITPLLRYGCESSIIIYSQGYDLVNQKNF